MNFVVLCSSRGTTFQACIDAMNHGDLTMPCLGLITDNAERECTAKATAADLPYTVATTEAEVEAAIAELGGNPDETIVATLGWMKILSPAFVGNWKNRIVNVHPSLLPDYGGKGMYGSHVHEAVLAGNETETGISVHLVDEGVDTGPIIVQKNCSVLPGDTVETLQKRVQELEKIWLPKVLEMIHQGEIILQT